MLEVPSANCLRIDKASLVPDGELILLHRLFCTFGADIAALNHGETESILIKVCDPDKPSPNFKVCSFLEVRHKIVDADLKHRVRGKLLEVVDLSYVQFEFSAFSAEQQVRPNR